MRDFVLGMINDFEISGEEDEYTVEKYDDVMDPDSGNYTSVTHYDYYVAGRWLDLGRSGAAGSAVQILGLVFVGIIYFSLKTIWFFFRHALEHAEEVIISAITKASGQERVLLLTYSAISTNIQGGARAFGAPGTRKSRGRQFASPGTMRSPMERETA